MKQQKSNLVFTVKAKILHGHNYSQIKKKAERYLRTLRGKSKRKVFIRSKYFGKKKVFFDYFWTHLLQKRRPDRTRRLRFLPTGVALIKKTTYKPKMKILGSLHYYRFHGKSPGGQIFSVQIKDNKNHGLQLISVFPIK